MATVARRNESIYSHIVNNFRYPLFDIKKERECLHAKMVIQELLEVHTLILSDIISSEVVKHTGIAYRILRLCRFEFKDGLPIVMHEYCIFKYSLHTIPDYRTLYPSYLFSDIPFEEDTLVWKSKKELDNNLDNSIIEKCIQFMESALSNCNNENIKKQFGNASEIEKHIINLKNMLNKN